MMRLRRQTWLHSSRSLAGRLVLACKFVGAALSDRGQAQERVSTCRNWPEVVSTYTAGRRLATREGYPFPRRP